MNEDVRKAYFQRNVVAGLLLLSLLFCVVIYIDNSTAVISSPTDNNPKDSEYYLDGLLAYNDYKRVYALGNEVSFEEIAAVEAGFKANYFNTLLRYSDEEINTGVSRVTECLKTQLEMLDGNFTSEEIGAKGIECNEINNRVNRKMFLNMSERYLGELGVDENFISTYSNG